MTALPSMARAERRAAPAAVEWSPGLPVGRLRRDHALMPVREPPSSMELRRRSEDELLALVVAGRLADDDRGSAARRAWGELVERDVDRVAGLVRTWRLAGRSRKVQRSATDSTIASSEGIGLHNRRFQVRVLGAPLRQAER